MLEALVRNLFPVVTAEFRSDYSLAESILRVQDARPPADSRSVLPQQVHVSVNGTGVKVSRFRLFSSNPIQPSFEGTFRQTPTGVILCGNFGTSRWIKFWHLGVLTFVAFLELIALILTPFALLSGQAKSWWAPFPFLGFLLLGVGNIKFGQWLARHDVAWLSRAIRQSLTI